MLRTHAALLIALVSGVAPTAAARPVSPQQPAGKPPARGDGTTSPLAAPYLDLPLLDLGDSFTDPAYGFEFRRPEGFEMVQNIEQLRSENILPEAQRTASDGTVQRIQIYLFRERGGVGDANVLIRAAEPAVKIQTPAELRAYFVGPDLARNIPSVDVGKVYQFKMRGGDVGFFAERELGNEFSGGVTIARQYMAYIRTGARCLLIQFTAPKDRFPEFADLFKASLGSFILRDNAARTAERASGFEPKRFDGEFLSGRVLFHLGLAVVLVALLLKFLPGRAGVGGRS